jgi:hypothetical protein
MQNQQADFAEIHRISHIGLNFPSNLSPKIASFGRAFPLTAKNPNVTVARIYVEVRKTRCP